jgi:hypothetical protein
LRENLGKKQGMWRRGQLRLPVRAALRTRHVCWPCHLSGKRMLCFVRTPQATQRLSPPYSGRKEDAQLQAEATKIFVSNCSDLN